MNELKELYPSVSSKLSFRLSPNGNITFTDKTGRLKTLKDDAWFIYSFCDGQKKMKEILHDILMECDTNEEAILSFLLDANKREYIVFKNAKELHKINIYGDAENYYPTYASVVLTEKCNISCIYCYGNYSPAKSTYLSFEDAKKIFQKLKEKGLVGLELSGGEPLTNPDFLIILNLAFEEFNHISNLSKGVII